MPATRTFGFVILNAPGVPVQPLVEPVQALRLGPVMPRSSRVAERPLVSQEAEQNSK